jgi:hypothetical protein
MADRVDSRVHLGANEDREKRPRLATNFNLRSLAHRRRKLSSGTIVKGFRSNQQSVLAPSMFNHQHQNHCLSSKW